MDMKAIIPFMAGASGSPGIALMAMRIPRASQTRILSRMIIRFMVTVTGRLVI
jgi:hypothetical protein